MQRSRWRRLVALLMLLALVAASCGNDDDTTADGDGADGDGDGGAELATVPGFDGSTITVGAITPLSGLVAAIGEPLTNGQRVFVEGLNARGGIAGQYQVELLEGDSQYNPAVAQQQYTQMRDSVVMLAQLLGTPTVQALLQSLEEDNVVAQPASLDADWLREQQLLPVGPPYQVEAANALDWWVNQEGNADSVVCWAGHDDPYGEAGLEGVQAAAETLGVEIAEEVAYSPTDSQPEAHAPNIGRLRDAGCEFVVLTSTLATTGAILGAAAGASYAPTWVANSPSWINALATSPIADYVSANYHVVAPPAAWGDESVPGMAQMLEDLAAYAPDQEPDFYFVFGYATMMAVAEVLEAAVEMGDLSREGIVAAMNSIEVIETMGLVGDYEWGPPEDRVPPRLSQIMSVDQAAADRGYWTPLTEPFASEAAESLTFE